jgi:Serine endopeptidase inhibitors
MKDKVNDVPFFARYLEGQEFPNVRTNIKAGATTKHPSDLDEYTTQKYPSDGDEYADS